MSKRYNVLFLCTGNSARSILAEAILNHLRADNFHGFSAGSQPTGIVSPNALSILAAAHVPTENLRSKGWDEFARPGAPNMDFIITVCDNAAGETCPVWPGHPVTAHWGMQDPAAVKGNAVEIDFAFRQAFLTLRHRINLFLNLPLASLDAATLKKEINLIGRQ